jgi:hypothetical protein
MLADDEEERGEGAWDEELVSSIAQRLTEAEMATPACSPSRSLSDFMLAQASNNTKAQFANSLTLSKEIMNTVMDALAAHTTMSKPAIASERVRDGLKDVLLGPAQLYEALRERAGEQAG